MLINGKSHYCDVGCKDVTILKLRRFVDEIFLRQLSVFQYNLIVKLARPLNEVKL